MASKTSMLIHKVVSQHPKEVVPSVGGPAQVLCAADGDIFPCFTRVLAMEAAEEQGVELSEAELGG